MTDARSENGRSGRIREVPLDALRPHPSNYRTHPPDQVGRIAESLRRYGQRRAIVVQASTGYVLAGCGMWLAARQLGWPSLRCDWWDCSDEEARAYLVEDNEAWWGAQDDRAALAELIADLSPEHCPPSFPPERIEDLLREVGTPSAPMPERWRELDRSLAADARTAICPRCGCEFPV